MQYTDGTMKFKIINNKSGGTPGSYFGIFRYI